MNMKLSMRQLEDQRQGESWLAGFADPRPSDACRARLGAAIDAELSRRQRRVWSMPTASWGAWAAAAMILMSMGVVRMGMRLDAANPSTAIALDLMAGAADSVVEQDVELASLVDVYEDWSSGGWSVESDWPDADDYAMGDSALDELAQDVVYLEYDLALDWNTDYQ
jgi:hypothetical protein